ncbi:hypothetical protein [Flagellimonas flava]|uniref:hypothetical protein n=1 Tax=Flagellimonas flava TaxID=570519 RepID=UPI003D645E1A
MKVGPIPLFLVLFTIFSCSDQETQQKLVDTQRKLVATEQKLLEAINTNQSNAELIKMYVETVQNVIHSSNDKYTIRIDQTQEGKLRYASWMQPKTPLEKPDIVLYNGEIEKTGSWGVAKYKFSGDNQSYIVETVPVKRRSKLNHIFLEVLEGKTQKFYGKMKDLNLPN